MGPSFSIDFYFTDTVTVYKKDTFRARWERKKFISALLYAIWEINHDLTDASFPLEKIEIQQGEGGVYIPYVEMSMRKDVMDSFTD